MAVSDHPGLSFWSSSSPTIRETVRETLTAIVVQDTDELVSRFYSTFLTHGEASAFLSHSVVNERLHHSLRNWLLDLIRVDPFGDLTAFDKRQVQIGEIHARLKIPNHLVMEGISLLKTAISEKIVALDLEPESAPRIIILLGELLDYAMRLMTAAYVSDTKRRVQTDEAFRLFSLGQDINLERETQRAALMEWSHSVLFNLLGHGVNAKPALLTSSPFGLWARHRATVLFQGSPLIENIQKLIQEIDRRAMPSMSDNRGEAIIELQRLIDEIKFLLNDLFQAAASFENGRDPLTRALNRRFLPSVLGREIMLAKDESTPLTVLMADIDHFKAINDAYGHSAGDVVLSQIAEVLLNTVRSNDFVFRYGGEEFLVVLVETDEAEAAVIAERIRHQIATERLALPDGTILSVTTSIGLAGFDGHPDYQYLIDAADKALYRAKKTGRDRVVSASMAAG